MYNTKELVEILKEEILSFIDSYLVYMKLIYENIDIYNFKDMFVVQKSYKLKTSVIKRTNNEIRFCIQILHSDKELSNKLISLLDGYVSYDRDKNIYTDIINFSLFFDEKAEANQFLKDIMRKA